jgi:hypothetical protein
MEVVLIRFYTGTVDFHLNNIGIDAINGGAEGLVEHACSGETSFVPQPAHQDLIRNVATLHAPAL